MINQQQNRGAASVRLLFLVPFLISLTLPVAGYYFIESTAGLMLAQATEQQQLKLNSVNQLITNDPELLSTIELHAVEKGAIYAHETSQTITVDGQENEWLDIPAAHYGQDQLIQLNKTFTPNSLSATLKIQRSDTHTYLLLAVLDDQVVYREISHISIHRNDHVRLAFLDTGNRLQRYTLATEQPGQLIARVVTTGGRALRPEPKIEGFWRAMDDGYQIEIAIDNSLLGNRFSFNIADVDDFDSRDIQFLLGNQFTDSAKELGFITRRSKELETALDRQHISGVRVTSASGNLIAGDILEGHLPVIGIDLQSNQEFIARVETIVPTAAIEQFRVHSFKQLAVVTLGILVLGLVLSYLTAGRLLSRIRKMGQELEATVDDQGRVLKVMREPTGRDELSNLSRRFASITYRLQQYNEYLENLSRRLAHELRTPVSVVRSSLEHLETRVQGEESKFVDRAKNGVTRLTSILNSMSEAARLEENFDKEDVTVFNLADVLKGCFEGYQNAFDQKPFELSLEATDLKVTGIPELFAQMLDKLVANAVQFSVSDQPVVIRLTEEQETAVVRISNGGPALPDQMVDQLFEPMISIRDETHREDSHLGLGLHVARLIATFHGGSVALSNREDREGVVATVRLPLLRLTSKLA